METQHDNFGLSPRLAASPGPDPGADAHLHLRWHGKPLSYRLQIKRGLRPAGIGAVVRMLEDAGDTVLLVTDQVTVPVAERLRALGIPFVDAAGNAYLFGEGLLIYVTGLRAAFRLPSPARGRVFQDKGLRVVFALLTDPALVAAAYRDIATAAGVAHGTVGIVMGELRQLGFVGEIAGRRRLLQGVRLLRHWVDSYARTLRPKLLLGTFRVPDIGWWQTFDGTRSGLALGGEAAAARSGLLTPQTVTLYGTRAAANRFQLEHRMTPASDGNVEFLSRFWAFDQQPPGLAPPLLIYADLLATADARCIEAAASLEDDLFARLQ